MTCARVWAFSTKVVVKAPGCVRITSPPAVAVAVFSHTSSCLTDSNSRSTSASTAARSDLPPNKAPFMNRANLRLGDAGGLNRPVLSLVLLLDENETDGFLEASVLGFEGCCGGGPMSSAPTPSKANRTRCVVRCSNNRTTGSSSDPHRSSVDRVGEDR